MTRKRACIAGALVLAIAVTSYFLWTRASALMMLRWFVGETGIPLEVRSASWKMNPRDLLRGKITDLSLDVFYPPLNTSLAVRTPVSYLRRDGHWSIHLEPTVAIGKLPPAKGTLDLELDVKRHGRKAKAEGAGIRFHLEQTQPLEVETPAGAVTASAWKLRGNVVWNSKWTGELDARFENVGMNGMKTKWLRISNNIDWATTPPLPLHTQSRITTGPIEILLGKAFIDEPQAKLDVAFDFDGRSFEHVELSVDSPFQFRLTGSYADGLLKTDFLFQSDLGEIVDRRIARWFAPYADVLRRAKAKGRAKIEGSFSASGGKSPHLAAKLDIDAKTIGLPTRDLFLDNVNLKAPLSYPDKPDRGSLKIGRADFHSVKIKDLLVDLRLAADGIDVTTEGDLGEDRPIRQFLWGGSIDIKDLRAHIGKDLEFSATASGGPFQLIAVQNDLCLFQKKPLKGTIRFNYPRIVQHKLDLTLLGTTDLVIFGGTANIGDLRLFLGEKHPRLLFDLRWNDLDMFAIGEWTKFGDMRGSLDGSLSAANFKFTDGGPTPISYQFTIQGRKRSEKPISFYGRAIDNLLQLLGSRKDEMPWYAGWAIGISTTFRNWFPATVEYMGFQAKSDGDWTELSTFDPPEFLAKKKYYLLFGGDQFKIPLNSHGVYPVVLKTEAFQEWLRGLFHYFKGLMKNENTEIDCAPLF